MKQRKREVGKEEELKSFFGKSKTVFTKAHPIVKSPLIDWTKKNHKLLEKCKGKIVFKGRVRD